MKEFSATKIVPLSLIDIVVSIYNQEKVMPHILCGLFNSTTTPFNLILVFDGCSDASERVTMDYVKSVSPKLLREVRVVHTPDVHENKSNNAGLKEATSDYVIMIQDDMKIQEKGWERRITFPLRVYLDVLAVGSRGAFDIVSMSSRQQTYSNKRGREFLNASRNIFYVRDYINRGPIAFDRQKLARLGFLDERFAPCNLDDANICLQGWKLYKWRSGLYWIDYLSKEKWNKTKQTPLSIRKEPASRAKNAEILGHDYAEYFASEEKHPEDVAVPWRAVDYTPDTSRISIAFHLFFSQTKFLISLCTAGVKSLIYRLKVSRFSPFSPYKKSVGKNVVGRSTKETRSRTEFLGK